MRTPDRPAEVAPAPDSAGPLYVNGERSSRVAHLTVSTVIPTYNRAELLQRALRSAVPQCEPGDEVLVVDDGSTDGTERVVRAFGPPVRYLRTSHLGAGAARNAGVLAASGDLVAFLDSDDEWMPGKLALQRAVMAALPEILFLASDFGTVKPSGERLHHQIANWMHDPRPWDDVLGPPVSSAAIAGLPLSAPAFRLYVGSLYETLFRRWSVCTITVVVRRERAGDALRFAEDLPTLEDLECFARLSGRGPAGFLDCETAWQHVHSASRLTDADELARASAALTLIERVWGGDEAFLREHRLEYQRTLDLHRDRKVRECLVLGRRGEARRELARMSAPARGLRLLSWLPGGLVRALYGLRLRVRSR